MDLSKRSPQTKSLKIKFEKKNIKVGKDVKSQAIKTAKSHDPCKVGGVRRKVETAEKSKPKVEEPKLPPGAKAINTFWTKVIKRDAGEDDKV